MENTSHEAAESKQKIAVIGLKGLPAFGGAATVGENIIERLKYRYDFTVYAVSSHTTYHGADRGYKQIVFKSFPIKKLNIFIYYLRSALHALFKGNFQLIHLHHVDGAFITPLLRLRYRVLATSHAKPQMNEKWPFLVKLFFSINEKLMLKMANEITAVSSILANEYIKRTRRNIHYIPNGINLSQQISNETIVYSDYLLFAAGRIIPLKGLHILLQALKKLHIQIKLIVIGDIDQIPNYKRQIKSLCVGLDVVFIDIIKEKSKLLNFVKNAKLFVFPSNSENMSIMLLEAAYVKTPVICSDIDANRSIFNNDEVTFFKTNDSSDLGEKLTWAWNNTEELIKKSLHAYQKLINHFNWSRIVIRYDELYSRLIEK